MTEDQFYSTVPICESFADVVRPENHRQLPAGWHMLVADVKNSTPAIRDGMYKDVNILGASSIIAVLNALGGLPIPYIFAGDGAIMAVPHSLLPKAQEALLGTKLMALKSFKLDLRIGSVPVSTLNSCNAEVFVSRYRVSPDMILASFSGRGVELAEQMIKRKDGCTEVLELGSDEIPRADFTGLECRWRDMQARSGEVVCLIAKSIQAERAAEVYGELIGQIARIYGDGETAHPLHHRNLKLSVACWNLRGEARARAGDSERFGYLSYLRYLFGLRLNGVKARLAMHLNAGPLRQELEDYKSVLVKNTDYRRFLDSYRQVLSGNRQQREALAEYLKDRFGRRQLAYGMHVSNRVLMTCLVFDRNVNHLHFLDGADGGFAVAASELKERLKSLAEPA